MKKGKPHSKGKPLRSIGSKQMPPSTGTGSSIESTRVHGLLKSPLSACFVIAVLTISLYSPVLHYGFINYDDEDYVARNANVQKGVKWQTLRWAVMSTEQANWHPLTWLSHALDCEFFGLDSGAHHGSNIIWHAVNSSLLFLVLRKLTGAHWRSLLASILFAVHPANVETVAWIAERKSLLSTFFFLLALAAYYRYTRLPGVMRYLSTGLFFACGLAAKPMVISFPCLLLVLDFWPLNRPKTMPWRQLILEKVPLVVLALASAVVTIYAQSAGGALRSLQRFSFDVRLQNAIYSYVVYLKNLFWPVGLALPYPHPGNTLTMGRVALSMLLLLFVSALAWHGREKQPYLLTGWLWFLGTLVPVIGLVQVGRQGMADRYLYLPMVGVVLMLVWSAADLAQWGHMGLIPRVAIVLTALVTLCWRTWVQIGYWQSNEELWTHTLMVTKDNAVAEDQLGMALLVLGRQHEALDHFQNAARIDPTDSTSRLNLGALYGQSGNQKAAIPEYLAALEWTTDKQMRGIIYADLGFAFSSLGYYGQAQQNLRLARESDPTQVDAIIESLSQFVSGRPSAKDCVKLGLLLRDAGRRGEAREAFQRAIEIDPSQAEALNALEREP
jgi:tetratricopeptide (TPR) repeat protein